MHCFCFLMHAIRRPSLPISTLAIAFAAFASALAPARAALIATDDFDSYAAGALSGANAGTGWGAAYSAQAGATVADDAAPVTYMLPNGVVLGGGNALKITGADVNSVLSRALATPVTDGSDVFLSFVFRIHSANSNGAEPDGAEIPTSGNILTGWVAKDADDDNAVDTMGVIGANGRATARVNNSSLTSSPVSAPLVFGQNMLFVVKYTGWDGASYKACKVWLNPTPNDEASASTAVAVTKTATAGGSDAFNGIRVRTTGLASNGGRHFLIDALRVGTSWADVVGAPTGVTAAPADVPRVVVFGDSLSSGGPGNNPSTGPASTPEYPKLTWITQLSPLAGYGALGNHQVDGIGTNYAKGGHTTADMVGRVGDFLADYSNVASLQNLYVLWCGGNDVGHAVQDNAFSILLSPSSAKTTIVAVAEAAADRMEAQIQRLAASGATRFYWIDLPNLGATPAVENYATQYGLSSLKGTLADIMQSAAAAFNAKMPAAIARLTAANPGITIRTFSAWDTFNAIIADPAAHGFTNVTSSCAADGVTTAAANNYLFWDNVHPTAHGHNLIANQVLADWQAAGLVVPPPAPAITAVYCENAVPVPGDIVSITGSNLAGLSAVTIGGIPAEIIGANNTFAKVLFPAGATAGAAVTAATAPSSNQTTHVAAWTAAALPPVPSVTGFSTTTAAPGDSVTLTGQNLSGIVTLAVGGKPAAITAQSDAELTFTVPEDAPLGAAGIALDTLAGDFVALQQLTIKTTPSNPDLIAEDNFDSYTPGSTLASQSAGGTGWVAAWTTQAATTVTVSHDPADLISYTLDNGTILGSGTAGSVIVVSSTATANNFDQDTALQRDFATAPAEGADLFVSFIYKIKDLSKTDDTTFSSGNNLLCWFGKDSAKATTDTAVAVGYSGGFHPQVNNARGSSVGSHAYGQTYFAVVKYTGWDGTAYRTAQVWRNPKTTDENSSVTTITRAYSPGSGGSTAITGIRVRTNNLIAINPDAGTGRYHVVDAIRVGKTWASVVGLPAPAITGITPTAVHPGDSITITGTNLDDATVTIGGVTATVTANTATSITVTVPSASGAVGGAVSVVVTTAGGTVTADQTLTVTLLAPAIASIYPLTVYPGGNVTITGSNLDDATVTIGGEEAVITENTGSSITVTVPVETAVATGIAVAVTTAGGTVIASQALTVTPPPPVVTGITPLSVAPGGSITITGANLDGATVTIGSVAATITAPGATSLTVTVPEGVLGENKAVAVTTAGGTTTAAQTLTITAVPPPAPVITGITPTDVHPGGSITITGTNLVGATVTTVTIGGVAATVTASSATSLTVTVPEGVLGDTVAVAVTTDAGTTTAAQTLAITKAAQPALVVTAVTGKKYGDAAFQLAATGGAGMGALTFARTAGTDATATVSEAGLVTITGAGDITVTASKTADARYAAATSAPLAITIAKADQPALVITPVTGKTAADAPFTLAVTGGAGTGALTFARTAGTDAVATVSAEGEVTITGAGEITVTATKAGDANHNPATSAPLAITIAPTPDYDTFTTVAENGGWVPLTHSLDIAEGGVFDFAQQGLLDAPAGKHGALHATAAGHFEFENRPGVRARFWGVNIVQMANFLNTHAQADQLAARLARSGYNTVRLHLFDEYLVSSSISAGGDSWDLDTARLEKLDYLFYALKQQGIYINIDLYGSRGFSETEAASFGPGITTSIAKNNCKGLFAISDAALESWKNFATNLLTHANPYTGLTWAADPALIGICPVNENPPHRDSVSDAIPTEVSSLFKARYTALTGSTTYKGADWNRFVFENARASNDAMATHIRSLGSKALITTANNTVAAALVDLRSRYDYVDGHLYWDHPSFPVNSWSLPINFSQSSATATSAYNPARMMPTRILGKPFTSTEFHFCRPNRYRAEGPLLMPAYASLQDWDAMYNFDYAKDIAGATTGTADNYFAIANDPVGLVGDRLGALLFLRGDIAPATTTVAYAVTDTEAYANDSSGNPGREFDDNFRHVGLVARIGSLPGAPAAVLAANPGLAAAVTGSAAGLAENAAARTYVAGTSLVTKLRDDGILPAAGADGTASETGQLTLNTAAGIFRAVTPRGEHFILAPGATLAGDRVTVANGSVFGTVSVVALKTASEIAAGADAPALAAARRLLVTHLTDALTTGMTFAAADRKQLTAWGSLPHLVRAGSATLDLTLPAGGWTAWAVDMTGARLREHPLVRVGDTNVWRMEISTAGISETGAQFAYELVLTGSAAPPVVTGVSPLAAHPGDSVTITGENLFDATVTIGGAAAAVIASTGTSLAVTVPAGAFGGDGAVVVSTAGGAVTAAQTIAVTLPEPVISDVFPLAVAPGSSIAITGANLAGASVAIGGISATVTADGATSLTVTVPEAVLGENIAIVVTTGGGTVTASQTLAVTGAPPPAPTISNILPLNVHPGALVTITGQNLAGATVTIGSVAAEIVANTGTAITVRIPSGTAGGLVSVTTASGGTSSTRQVIIKPDAGDSGVLPAPAGVVASSGSANYKLYVSDIALHTIQVIASGTITTFAGNPGSPGLADGTGTIALFNRPRGLSINHAGALIVADSGNNLLRSATADGTVATTGTAGADADLAAAAGVAAFDAASGETYIADTGNHLIKKIIASGEVRTVAGSATSGTANGPLLEAQFNSPAGVAVDVTGSYLYVADTGNHVIRLIDLSGGVVSTFAGQMGVAGDADGGALGASTFRFPGDLIVDGTGDVYVADTGNSRIRLITSDDGRTVGTLVGGAPGFVDGGGTAARFSSPSALALAEDGSIYVADTGNGALRRIAPDASATVTTLALKSPASSSVTPPPGQSPGGSGGGGGGAPSVGFLAALAVCAALHLRKRR
ncbi:hypothetical protein AW736_23745 [Termitidicoccus mucosus]|uniref:IPT/TIG domain-containing protein n=2 Tax=Termitidicoccus mucosus TaxID=1184151 RepID=A0A178ICD0_9BACT|nr:hypothetical protein AW736_23745 [Opitutaceae bacterium TSB47]